MDENEEPLLSIITPCFNEEEGIRDVWLAVKGMMAESLPSVNYEHIFVDNASTDRTVAVIQEFSKEDAHVVLVVNPRNVGVHRSWMNGLHQSRGSGVMPLLADLQTPLTVVPQMVEAWLAGSERVLAVRHESEVGSIRRGLNSLYYTTMQKMGRPPLVPGFIGFGVYAGPTLEFLKTNRDPEPFLRGLIAEAGNPTEVVYYSEPSRKHGRSKSGVRRDLRFIAFSLMTHSRFPVNVALWVALSWVFLGLIGLGVLTVAAWQYGLPHAWLWVLLSFIAWLLGGALVCLLALLVAMATLLVEFAKDRPLELPGSRRTPRS